MFRCIPASGPLGPGHTTILVTSPSAALTSRSLHFRVSSPACLHPGRTSLTSPYSLPRNILPLYCCLGPALGRGHSHHVYLPSGSASPPGALDFRLHYIPSYSTTIFTSVVIILPSYLRLGPALSRGHSHPVYLLAGPASPPGPLSCRVRSISDRITFLLAALLH